MKLFFTNKPVRSESGEKTTAVTLDSYRGDEANKSTKSRGKNNAKMFCVSPKSDSGRMGRVNIFTIVAHDGRVHLSESERTRRAWRLLCGSESISAHIS